MNRAKFPYSLREKERDARYIVFIIIFVISEKGGGA